MNVLRPPQASVSSKMEPSMSYWKLSAQTPRRYWGNRSEEKIENWETHLIKEWNALILIPGRLVWLSYGITNCLPSHLTQNPFISKPCHFCAVSKQGADLLRKRSCISKAWEVTDILKNAAKRSNLFLLCIEIITTEYKKTRKMLPALYQCQVSPVVSMIP